MNSVVKPLLLALVVSFLTGFRDPSGLEHLNIPDVHQQVMLVTSANWDATTGTLRRWERTGNNWRAVGEPIPVSLGKNGMAWGLGMHQPIEGTHKKEGDGKAPAGIFTLGTAFGYASDPSFSYPYKPSTSRDYFIDDVNAPEYNTWQTIPADEENMPRSKWNSYERMRRKDHLYEWGVVVEHNMSPATKGAGSAIFLHVWRTPNSPTLGCTAYSKANMLAVLTWLNAEKQPLLIQVPQTEWARLSLD